MWQFQKIAIKNISSHKETIYSFKQSQCTLINGINIDKGIGEDGNYESNGAGKSSLYEGINIGIVGESLKKLKTSEIIRNGESSGSVEIFLINNALNKSMRILRVIYANSKSSTCDIWINEILQKDLIDINQKNKFIFEQLGITRDEFYSYYQLSANSYQSFISSSDRVRKEIINRFSRANLLDNTESLIDEDVSEISKKLIPLNNSKQQILGKISLYQSKIDEEDEETWNTQKQGKIAGFQLQITNSKNIISNNKEEIIKKKEELNDIKSLILKFQKEEFVDYTSQYKDLKKSIEIKEEEFKNNTSKIDLKISKAKTTIKETETEIEEFDEIKREHLSDIKKTKDKVAKLKAQLDGHIDCPKCEHKFLLDEEITYEEVESKIKSLERELIEFDTVTKEMNEVELELKQTLQKREDKLTQLQLEIKTLKEASLIEIKKIEKEIEENGEKAKLQTKKINELTKKENSINESIEELNEEIKEEEENIPQFKQKIALLKEQIFESEVEEYEAKIKESQKEILKLEEQIEVINKDIEDKERWILLFQRFKSFLANKSINSIAGYCNLYLEKMKSSLTLYIEGFKVLSTKKIKENIDFQISRNGVTRENLEKLSAGERATIELSIVLTLQKLNNLSSESGGLDYLAIDEVIVNALDAPNLYKILHLLNSVKSTIMIVSHGRIDKPYENTITIKKKNEISQICE